MQFFYPTDEASKLFTGELPVVIEVEQIKGRLSLCSRQLPRKLVWVFAEQRGCLHALGGLRGLDQLWAEAGGFSIASCSFLLLNPPPPTIPLSLTHTQTHELLISNLARHHPRTCEARGLVTL